MDAELLKRISVGEGLGLVVDRRPQPPAEPASAEGIVVSADNHWPLSEDIFYEAFPRDLKDKAPRIWWDEEAGIFQMGEGFKTVIPKTAEDELRSIEAHPGARSLAARLADMDAEGVAKEIVFPQILQLYFRHPDFRVREAIFRIHNDYMAGVQRASGGRTFPVAIPEFWDPAAAAASIRKIKEMGFKSLLLPNIPGVGPDGQNVVYNSEAYDPVWAAIQDCDITICHHIGETFLQEGINGVGCRLMHDLSSNLFRLHFGRYVFGRILDKFPYLRIVFCEAGVAWAANAIQDAEMIYNSHALMFDSRPDKRPSWYWHNNFYTTFMTDIAGMRLLDIIGADRVMWSVDYPHNEGTFGYSQDSKQEVLRAASKEEARLILGETAMRVFDLY
jgi:predicted TIM-barrel fold metal-dependent hydrolase